MQKKQLRLAVRITEATDEVRHASLKRRKKLALDTREGREKYLEDVVTRHDLWGTSVENYFRLKALCLMKRKEVSIV